ncbi:MAG: hypothetical protein ACTSQC_12500 [Candidatus Heimdallarchaeaceae archaeon]
MNQREEKNPTDETIEELLVALEEKVLANPEQLFADKRSKVDKIINELAEKEVQTTINIVRVILEEFIETGESQYHSRAWFCERLPWKKSRITERLQQLVKERILRTNERKYAINVTSPFVRRIKQTMRLDSQEIDYEKMIEGFAREINQEEEDKEPKEKEQQEEKRRAYRKGTVREIEKFIQEIRRTYFEYVGDMTEYELEEEIAWEIEKKILMTIGITKNTNEQ